MRDEMDGRIWAANHQQFAEDIDHLVGRIRAFSAKAVSWEGSTAQLIALVGAFLITALTFDTTTV